MVDSSVQFIYVFLLDHYIDSWFNISRVTMFSAKFKCFLEFDKVIYSLCLDYKEFVFKVSKEKFKKPSFSA